MEKIRAAHYDNKHVNEHLAAHEIEVVEKKRKEGLLSEEEYKKELAEAKRTTLSHKVQMIFQDPIASLNPRMTVRNIIAEGLIINGVKDKAYIDQEVNRVLKLVGLVPEHATRYPHEFSGGQRQRIGIARAIIMKPELIVADEPVSALDVSVQAQVINLLNELRNNLGLTIIFIAHNLSVVKYFCDRIAVMYYGNIVELASSDELFAHPLHPYTKSLLSAVPFPDPIVEKNRTRIIYNPMTDHDYSKQEPTYREIVPGHFVRCNDEEAKRYLEELKK
jgi:ABC-type oligopeptide transport system ATPase subunit